MMDRTSRWMRELIKLHLQEGDNSFRDLHIAQEITFDTLPRKEALRIVWNFMNGIGNIPTGADEATWRRYRIQCKDVPFGHSWLQVRKFVATKGDVAHDKGGQCKCTRRARTSHRADRDRRVDPSFPAAAALAHSCGLLRNSFSERPPMGRVGHGPLRKHVRQNCNCNCNCAPSSPPTCIITL